MKCEIQEKLLDIPEQPVPPPLSRAVEIAALAKAFEEMRDALEGRQHVERYTQAMAHV